MGARERSCVTVTLGCPEGTASVICFFDFFLFRCVSVELDCPKGTASVVPGHKFSKVVKIVTFVLANILGH